LDQPAFIWRPLRFPRAGIGRPSLLFKQRKPSAHRQMIVSRSF
jgi:hypothetical protein